MIEVLERELAGPVLRDLWQILDESHKLAVQEAVHDEAGSLHADMRKYFVPSMESCPATSQTPVTSTPRHSHSSSIPRIVGRVAALSFRPTFANDCENLYRLRPRRPWLLLRNRRIRCRGASHRARNGMRTGRRHCCDGIWNLSVSTICLPCSDWSTKARSRSALRHGALRVHQCFESLKRSRGGRLLQRYAKETSLLESSTRLNQVLCLAPALARVAV